MSVMRLAVGSVPGQERANVRSARVLRCEGMGRGAVYPGTAPGARPAHLLLLPSVLPPL